MPFFSKKREISEEDLMDLHNKVAIVTGGYTGIGYATVQFLARKGAKVYIATRNETGTKESMEALEKEGLGGGTIHWLKLDLEDPRAVKSAAEEFLTKEDRLDILINNAGKAVGPYNLTKDGLRDVMAINYLGHFILTECLLPLLTKTSKEKDADVRIINLSSRSHAQVKPTSFKGKDSLNTEYGTSVMNELTTYGLSKLANVHHIKHLQRRLDSSNFPIICMAINPGGVVTPNAQKLATRGSFITRKLLSALVRITFVSPRQGAMNSAYAAASPEVRKNMEKFKGAYLEPVGKIASGSVQARDSRLADELHNTTLEILTELDIECGPAAPSG